MNRILIIDDDPKNIFAMEATLRSEGWSVITATSATDGLNILYNNRDIGVVLMDMMMPGIDGYEAVSLIRNNNTLRHIPVIAVTAQAMNGDREKCLAAGANEYVSKPVDVERLFGLINRFIL